MDTLFPMSAMDAEALQRFLVEAFPDYPPLFVVEEAAGLSVRLRLPKAALRDRPGGTVSGPTLMAFADSTAWIAVCAQIGPVALAVTTSLHIDFLRKPEMVDLFAWGEVLKLGRHLAVVDVAMRSEGRDELVAKAQVTYSIPPR